jgi:tRNA-specific 2-thiouridylase
MDEARTEDSGAKAGTELDRALAQLAQQPGFPRGGRVVVAMSGGIDSSVAAALLQRAGIAVVGLSMRLFQPNALEGGVASEGKCCTLDDFQDARRVAQEAGFPHYVVDLEARFKETVIEPFKASYLAGLTPSPCINCNRYLKFEELLERARGLAASHVATGHYARILATPEGFALARAADPEKDQSYFLYHLNQEMMNRFLFPLGGFTKREVRRIAWQLGLHHAGKPESQEICFITEGRYDRFLEREGAVGGDQPGEIRHLDGRRLGSHQGYWKFTVGQRKGLGIAAPTPLYVAKVSPETGTVWVGGEADLGRTALTALEVNWCAGRPDGPFPCRARIRSRSEPAEALVVPVGEDRAEVTFREPQRAVAPGQAVVFYRGDEVVGGGWIAPDRP